MATINPFDLLCDDEGEDLTQLAAKAALKAEPKKPAPAAAGKGAQPAAKMPTKPAPPAQAVQESRGGSRGGFRQGERGSGRGGRGGYGQTREYGSEDTNGYRGGGGYGGYGARTGGEEGAQDRERGPRPPYQGGRRGGYQGEFGDDSERPPRRNHERHSGTGRGYEMKRDGAGRGNWGTTSSDELLAQETEALKQDEKAPVPEKQGAPEDAPQAEENKVGKDATANVEEEKEEEDKEMTLEEFEKIMEEKRKALLALKSEERKVEIDKDLQAMQLLSTKKGNDEVFIKLGADKDALKKKENAERDERAKKSVSINEFLKPAEGERYYGGRGKELVVVWSVDFRAKVLVEIEAATMAGLRSRAAEAVDNALEPMSEIIKLAKYVGVAGIAVTYVSKQEKIEMMLKALEQPGPIAPLGVPLSQFVGVPGL